MGVKKAIIHLGMPKTGSSSIQHTLFTNTASLENNSFRYLREWKRNHHNQFHNLFFRYSDCPPDEKHFGSSLFSADFKKRENKRAINALQKVIKMSDCETLLLSGEYFRTLYLNATLERIKTFIEKYFTSNSIETTIVYYVRNPLVWIDSWTSQIIFSSGYLDRDGDFFETAIKQYHGVFNLQSYFGDRLKVIKFEDACMDNGGLVANFLRVINFPEREIANIDMSESRVNESRSMEVIEFAHFVTAMEARNSLVNYFKQQIPGRFYRDITPLKNIKGVKFALSFQSKVELWDRLQGTVKLLKENLNIDYTDYKVPAPLPEQIIYNKQTIQGFIDAFPKLDIVIQKYFLIFFKKKYMETAQEKFKRLYFTDSAPYKMYKRNNSFLKKLSTKKNITLRFIKKVIKVKMPKI